MSRRIDAAPQDVWRSLVDPAELVAWYGEVAEVEQGEGGTYRIRWGEGVEGTSVITTWDPPQRLVLTHTDREGSAEAQLDEPITEELTIQPVTLDATLVRVVQGGIPLSADWDVYFEAETHGWRVALEALAAHLESGDRVPRAEVSVTVPFTRDPDRVWDALLGPEGLALPTGARQHFDVTTGSGERLRGLIWSCAPPSSLMARMDEPGPAYLSLRVDPLAGEVEIRWSCYGWHDADLADLRRRWTGWVENVVALSAPGDG